MDWQAEFERFREWAFNMDSAGPRAMWALLAVLGSYILGGIVSGILRSIFHRLGGLKKHKDAQPESEASGDNVMLDIVGSMIRVVFVLGGLAVGADIIGVYDITEAQSLGVAASKGLIILIAVWFLGSWLSGRVRRFGDKMDRTNTGAGKTLFAFLGSLVKFAALAVGLIAALQQFGFPIASLVAVVGAAGLAIALALQDTLKAVAAGVIIAILRPYRIGDFVEIDGELGTVADITPFTTILNTLDNKQVIITNDAAWAATIENFNANPRRRLDEIIGISYDDDIRKAMAIMERVVTSDPRALKDPPFWVKVNTLNEYSVDLRFRIWCKTADYFDFRCDMLQYIKEAFDEEGITIPFPHQVEIAKEGARLVLAREVDDERKRDTEAERGG